MDLQKKFPETNKSIEQMKSKFKAGNHKEIQVQLHSVENKANEAIE